MVEGVDWDDHGHDHGHGQDHGQGLEPIVGSPPTDPNPTTVNPMIGSHVGGLVTGRESEPDSPSESGESGDLGDEEGAVGHVEAHHDQGLASVGL